MYNIGRQGYQVIVIQVHCDTSGSQTKELKMRRKIGEKGDINKPPLTMNF
jgi:hypothetical protein